MAKVMLFNVNEPEEIRAAIVENGRLAEFDIETRLREKNRNNIYRGVIVKIEPSIQAAFVDYGADRHGFLPFNEIHPDFWSSQPHHDRRPRIDEVLNKGQSVLVQVVREEVEQKGAALTTYCTLPGRYLVLMPRSSGGGVSRKIDDPDQRKQLRDLMKEIDPPEGFGCIVRTAGLGQPREEIQREMDALLLMWKNIQKQAKRGPKVGLVFQESDLIIRMIRDYHQSDVTEIWIDQESAFERAQAYLSATMPEAENSLKLYKEPTPLFSLHHVEEQIAQVYERRLPLPSGGSIVIDSTEALVAVDVNSGKTQSDRGTEDTAMITNLEACREIARQMRLRDLGGLIVIDFIGLRSPRNVREVERVFRHEIRDDKAKIKLGRISAFFGLLSLSRQRIRDNKDLGHFVPCECCGGRGELPHVEISATRILHRLHEIAASRQFNRVDLSLPHEIASYLLNQKRETLFLLEQASLLSIQIQPRSGHLVNLNADIVWSNNEAKKVARPPVVPLTPKAVAPALPPALGEPEPSAPLAPRPSLPARPSGPSAERTERTERPSPASSEALLPVAVAVAVPLAIEAPPPALPLVDLNNLPSEIPAWNADHFDFSAPLQTFPTGLPWFLRFLPSSLTPEIPVPPPSSLKPPRPFTPPSPPPIATPLHSSTSPASSMASPAVPSTAPASSTGQPIPSTAPASPPRQAPVPLTASASSTSQAPLPNQIPVASTSTASTPEAPSPKAPNLPAAFLPSSVISSKVAQPSSKHASPYPFGGLSSMEGSMELSPLPDFNIPSMSTAFAKKNEASKPPKIDATPDPKVDAKQERGGARKEHPHPHQGGGRPPQRGSKDADASKGKASLQAPPKPTPLVPSQETPLKTEESKTLEGTASTPPSPERPQLSLPFPKAEVPQPSPKAEVPQPSPKAEVPQPSTIVEVPISSSDSLPSLSSPTSEGPKEREPMKIRDTSVGLSPESKLWSEDELSKMRQLISKDRITNADQARKAFEAQGFEKDEIDFKKKFYDIRHSEGGRGPR